MTHGNHSSQTEFNYDLTIIMLRHFLGMDAPGSATVRRLIFDPATRQAMGRAARAKVLREHDLPVAAARLAVAIERVGRVPAA